MNNVGFRGSRLESHDPSLAKHEKWCLSASGFKLKSALCWIHYHTIKVCGVRRCRSTSS